MGRGESAGLGRFVEGVRDVWHHKLRFWRDDRQGQGIDALLDARGR